MELHFLNLSVSRDGALDRLRSPIKIALSTRYSTNYFTFEALKIWDLLIWFSLSQLHIALSSAFSKNGFQINPIVSIFRALRKNYILILKLYFQEKKVLSLGVWKQKLYHTFAAANLSDRTLVPFDNTYLGYSSNELHCDTTTLLNLKYKKITQLKKRYVSLLTKINTLSFIIFLFYEWSFENFA